MSNIYVNIHVIQDVPPANLNRDDSGSPKTAVYGGKERLRVSSQAWKQATRIDFAKSMPQEELGVRTKRLHALIAQRLEDRGVGDSSAKASSIIKAVGLSETKKKSKKAEEAGAVETEYLVYFGRGQVDRLADAIVANGGQVDGVDISSTLGSAHPLDVALFGRMIADLTQLNVDAAAQVAHALSTHAAPGQFDYYTAVDDEKAAADEAGAGMIGITEFNSGTLYRFASVGLEQLVDNMGDRSAAIDGIGRFVQSFATSLPGGKQNSFAALTRPALVMVEVRSDQPVNMVSAFEKPITAIEGGYLEPSLVALANFTVAETERWGVEPLLRVASYHVSESNKQALTKSFQESRSMPDLILEVKECLASSGGRDA